MGIYLKRCIKCKLCIALLLSCFNVVAFRQVAFAGQEVSQINTCNSVDDNAYANTRITNDLAFKLDLCRQNSNILKDDFWRIKNPFNENPIYGFINRFYYQNVTKKTYNNVAVQIIDSLKNFFGLGDQENDPYAETINSLDNINKSIRSAEEEMNILFNALGYSTKLDKISKAVNVVTTDLHGTTLGQEITGGYAFTMKDSMINYERYKESIGCTFERDNLKIRNLYNALDYAANIADWAKYGPSCNLYGDFSSLWALITDDLGGSSLADLYRACLLVEPNPVYAKNMFDRVFITCLTDLLTINEIMYYSNTAKIEQIVLATNNWDLFSEEDEFKGKDKNFIIDFYIKEGGTKETDGLYIQRGKVLLEERCAILDKALQIVCLEEVTPFIQVTTNSSTELMHSFGDAWIEAMQSNDSTITLYSDVVAFAKSGQKDFYGRALTSDENMTSSIVEHAADKTMGSKFFKNGALKVPNKTNIRLELNGHCLGDANSGQPAIFVEGDSKITVIGCPVDSDDSKDAQLGQMDGIILGNNIDIKLIQTDFNNLLRSGNYKVKEDKTIKEKSKKDGNPEKPSTNPEKLEHFYNYYSKPLNAAMISGGITRSDYSRFQKVDVDSCSFSMDDQAALGDNASGAIRLTSIPGEEANLQLNVTSCSFKNCVAKNSDGGAVYSSGKINIENSQFKNCVAENGNGGAICHMGNWYKDPEASLEATVLKKNKFFSNKAKGVIVEGSASAQAEHDAAGEDASDANIVASSSKVNLYKKKGGAVYSTGFLKLEGSNTFEGNEAGKGGAICSERSAREEYVSSLHELRTVLYGQLLFAGDGSNNFSNNKAEDGGAINTDSELTMCSCATFKGNEAYNNGGAIVMYNTEKLKEESADLYEQIQAKINFVAHKIKFENNSAKNGGAIWSQRDVNSDCVIVRDNFAHENGAIFMGDDATLKLCNDNTISFNSALRDCGGTKGRLSVSGYVNISDNVLKNLDGKVYQESNAVIPKEGLYVGGLLKEFSKLHISTNGNKDFKITDDKSNESEKDKCDVSWKERLEKSSEMISIDRPDQETKMPCLKTAKHGFRHVYWLEG